MSASSKSSGAVGEIVCSWPVEKYARFVQEDRAASGPLPMLGEDLGKAPKTGSWQVGVREANGTR